MLTCGTIIPAAPKSSARWITTESVVGTRTRHGTVADRLQDELEFARFDGPCSASTKIQSKRTSPRISATAPFGRESAWFHTSGPRTAAADEKRSTSEWSQADRKFAQCEHCTANFQSMMRAFYMQSFRDEFALRDFAHTCQYDPKAPGRDRRAPASPGACELFKSESKQKWHHRTKSWEVSRSRPASRFGKDPPEILLFIGIMTLLMNGFMFANSRNEVERWGWGPLTLTGSSTLFA